MHLKITKKVKLDKKAALTRYNILVKKYDRFTPLYKIREQVAQEFGVGTDYIKQIVYNTFSKNYQKPKP